MWKQTALGGGREVADIQEGGKKPFKLEWRYSAYGSCTDHVLGAHGSQSGLQILIIVLYLVMSEVETLNSN